MNKTSIIAANKEEDPDNLVQLLADSEDIKQQVDECTDVDSVIKAEMSVDDSCKVYSCDDPPISIPDIVMEQQHVTTLTGFILMLFVYIKNLNDAIAKFKS